VFAFKDLVFNIKAMCKQIVQANSFNNILQNSRLNATANFLINYKNRPKVTIILQGIIYG
jgi:hypothetical protein